MAATRETPGDVKPPLDRLEVRALLDRGVVFKLKAKALAEAAETGRNVTWQDLLRRAAAEAAQD